MLAVTTLAGDPITSRLSRDPVNQASIGGLKLATANGWFAARPSGTENIIKIYAESFRNEEHLRLLIHDAGQIVGSLSSQVSPPVPRGLSPSVRHTEGQG